MKLATGTTRNAVELKLRTLAVDCDNPAEFGTLGKTDTAQAPVVKAFGVAPVNAQIMVERNGHSDPLRVPLFGGCMV